MHTSKKEADQVAVLRARIARGIAKRSENLNEWSENHQFFVDGRGDDDLIGENDHEIVINKVFATVRAQLPALMFTRPKWEVHPKRPIMGKNGQDLAPDLAAAREHILNYWWRELDVQFQVRLAIIAAKEAFGAIKVGYTADFEDNPHAGAFKVNEAGELTIGSDGLPELESGDYLRDDSGDPIIDPDTHLPLLAPGEILTNEHFFIKYVHWSRLIFDPEGENDFNDHAWIAEEWCRPTHELREDRLLNGHRKDLQPTESINVSSDGDMLGQNISSGVEPDMGSAVKEDEERTRGYTIYDFRRRRILVIAESSGESAHEFLLRDDPLPPEQEHGPYVFLRFNEIPGRWEPLPDITPMKSPQEQINIINSKVATHISRADRKYGYDEAAFEDEEDIQQLLGGGDMTMVKIPGGPAAVWPIPQLPMDNAVYAAAAESDRGFNEVAGSSDGARGVAKAETATEASILENHGQVRESDQRELINTFVINVGRKLDQTLRANMSQDVWVSVGDSTEAVPYPAAMQGMYVTPADIQMEADLDVQMGSMLPKTNAIARQQFAQVFELLAKAPILFQVPELLDKVFEMFEIDNTGLSLAISEAAKQQAQAEQQQKQGGGGGGLPQENMGQGSPVGGIPTGELQ